MNVYILYSKEWFYTDLIAVFDSRRKAEEYMNAKVEEEPFLKELLWIEAEEMNPEYKQGGLK